MKHHRCHECGTRYTSLAQHVRDWHGWPFNAEPNNQFHGGPWMPLPVLLSRVKRGSARGWAAVVRAAMSDVERHRDYFQRELVHGRRVVFEWNAHHRWPDDAVMQDEQIIEGCEFPTPEAAASFDIDGPVEWHRFDDEGWEAACEWARGGDHEPMNQRFRRQLGAIVGVDLGDGHDRTVYRP